MDKDKYLAKIKKLMRLARGTSNPAEAASAMAKVQAFMREYGLSEADVDLSEVKECSSAGAPSDAVKVPGWVADLSTLVCRAFGVNCYFTQVWRSHAFKRVVKFYGPGERAEIAAYAFDVLGRQLRQARKEYQHKYCKRCKRATAVARADQFCEGWVSGAYYAVHKFEISPQEQSLMERYHLHLRQERGMGDMDTRKAKACRGDNDASWAGYEQGKNARLHHGVNGGTQEPLVIGR
ncbi:DUF2786 domain-containing protein [Erwinia typographi]|uniref:DUF2786 domain-containing protein n=1 Tax=Erwinia typographi TaxID=371042 RepID=UPI000AD6C640|nr:DUF2786 domain-containing protein [Erwinia typographi]